MTDKLSYYIQGEMCTFANANENKNEYTSPTQIVSPKNHDERMFAYFLGKPPWK